MARTSAGLVQAKLTHDWDTVTDLAPFIDAAYSLMNKVVQCAIDFDEAISRQDAQEIETWLAAHFYKYAADRQFQSRSVQGATTGGPFTGTPERTTYLDTAIILDTTGCLKALISGHRVRFGWLGKPHSEQIPYDQRD